MAMAEKINMVVIEYGSVASIFDVPHKKSEKNACDQKITPRQN